MHDSTGEETAPSQYGSVVKESPLLQNSLLFYFLLCGHERVLRFTVPRFPPPQRRCYNCADLIRFFVKVQLIDTSKSPWVRVWHTVNIQKTYVY